MNAHGTETVARAYGMYLEGVSLRSISRQLGVPYGTVHSWHARHSWSDKKQQIETCLILETERFFRKSAKMVASEGLLNIARKAGEVLSLIENAITSIQDPPDSKDLLNISRAFARYYATYEKLLRTTEDLKPCFR
jgi:hypothetical protein